MSYVDKANQWAREFEPHAPYTQVVRFAAWLDQQAAQVAMGDKPAPRSHSCPMPSQEGDEYVCRHPLCGRRWDIHEDRPPCPVV